MCFIEQKMGHGFGQVTCKLGAPNCGGATRASGAAKGTSVLGDAAERRVKRCFQTVFNDVGCGKNKGQQRLNIVVPP